MKRNKIHVCRGGFNRPMRNLPKPTGLLPIGNLVKLPLQLVLCSSLLLITPVHAQDLLSVYREALQDNPQLEKAREGLEAVL